MPCWPAAAKRLRRALAESRSFTGPARTRNRSLLPERTFDTSMVNPLARMRLASPRAFSSDEKLPSCTHQLPPAAAGVAGAAVRAAVVCERWELDVDVAGAGAAAGAGAVARAACAGAGAGSRAGSGVRTAAAGASCAGAREAGAGAVPESSTGSAMTGADAAGGGVSAAGGSRSASGCRTLREGAAGSSDSS